MKDDVSKQTYQGDSTTGFASPAQDYVENTIDLSDTLELRKPSRYLMRVEGDSLSYRQIQHGDILVIETDAKPRPSGVVVASVNDEFLVGEVREIKNDWFLISPSKDNAPICLTETENASIWGIVVSLVRERV